MAAVQKRRASTRSKTQKNAKVADSKKKGPVRPRAWVRDLSTLLFVGVGVSLLASLSSYLYAYLSGGVLSPSRNIMGPIGHITATLLLGTLGFAAFFPVFGLLWLACFRSWHREDTPLRYGRVVVLGASLLLLVGLTTVFCMIGGPRVGGSLGAASMGALSKSLGLGGALLVTGFVCAVALAILLQRSIGDVANGVSWAVRSGSTLLFVRLPVLMGRGVATGTRYGVKGAQTAGTGAARLLFSRGVYTEPHAPSLPKPKLRKNTTATDFVIEPKARREDVVVKAIEQPETYDRADPIIVKPKPIETSGVTTLRSLKKKAGKGAKVTEPEVPSPFDSYTTPDVRLLTSEEEHEVGEDDEELRQKAEQIESKLRDFNIAGRVTQVHPGPVITLFEFEPAPGVKVGRIAALQDDLAMSLKASSIRIIAPIPKRGTVGIEVPNKHRAMVRLRDVIESQSFSSADSSLSVVLGKDTYGDSVVVDIATMPHLLMAGATGTGKSVCINTLLLSLLYRAHPSELGLILIDPKILELSIYDGIPHLRVPVVTDPRQAKAVLTWAAKEMDRRYRYMQRFGVRNIDGYNQVVSGMDAQREADEKLSLNRSVDDEEVDEIDTESEQSTSGDGIEPTAPEVLKPLPKLVIVIDELADLMLTSGREIEELITRLAQKARAAGIHLIVATQRPSVDVITGLIKANFPARLSFRVSSRIDSRTILDSMGAERLLGKGDMLFMTPGGGTAKRIHGAFVSDAEVGNVVNAIKAQCGPQYDENIIAAVEKALTEESSSKGENGENGGDGAEEYDEYYDKALELVVEKGQASTSMIQRTFRIGYNRAARIIEQMEREGVVGKMDGVRPREILVPPSQQ